MKQEDTEPRKNESRPDYILAVGEAAACRLALLDEIFGPHSLELLAGAGLAQGMRGRRHRVRNRIGFVVDRGSGCLFERRMIVEHASLIFSARTS